MRRHFNIEMGTGVTNKGSYAFKLDDLNEYSYWTSLFDSYKICAIKLDVIPRGNVMTVNGGDLNSGVVHEAVDYDDANQFTDLDTAVEYGNIKSHRITDRFKRYFKPMFSAATYVSSTSTGYGSRRGWLDCAYHGIPHYAWKYIAQLGGSPGTATYYWDVVATYYVSFRSRH